MIRTDDDQVYTGITTDMARRWREHCHGKAGARYFRGRKPQQLCLLEIHPDRSAASKREAAIKQCTRAAKELLISQQTSDQLTYIAKFHRNLNSVENTLEKVTLE